MEKQVTSIMRVARTAAGLSQVALAEKIGSYQFRLSRIERGISAPDPDEVEKIASALGCAPADIFGEVVDK